MPVRGGWCVCLGFFNKMSCCCFQVRALLKGTLGSSLNIWVIQKGSINTHSQGLQPCLSFQSGQGWKDCVLHAWLFWELLARFVWCWFLFVLGFLCCFSVVVSCCCLFVSGFCCFLVLFFFFPWIQRLSLKITHTLSVPPAFRFF